MANPTFHFNFLAIDKDSSSTYGESASVTTEAELQEAYESFKQSVPFPRWYSEHDGEDANYNELPAEQASWLENLE